MWFCGIAFVVLVCIVVVLGIVAVVVVVFGVVVAVLESVVVLCCRLLGRLMIIRSICLCVRRSLFSSSWVIVHDTVAYMIVGVIVPWNNLNRPLME